MRYDHFAVPLTVLHTQRQKAGADDPSVTLTIGGKLEIKKRNERQLGYAVGGGGWVVCQLWSVHHWAPLGQRRKTLPTHNLSSPPPFPIGIASRGLQGGTKQPWEVGDRG